MTPERWEKVKEVFQSALDRAPSERSAFLSSACGGDDVLLKEVESLLSSHEKDGSFIDSPAYQAAAKMLAGDLELKAGQTIGHYEIRSKLGAGGMGEVYLAEDTQLGRRVAIKFLPPDAIADERAKKRLVREARAAATLDHPHICSVYEVGEADGRSFIVMQYIEGETLDLKLKRKPDLKESLSIASQIAEALGEAHTHGIIHRDIKPQNIMFTARGQVKVLDFGLARVMRAKVMSDGEAETATLLTQAGAIVGTVPYMSPEQVRAEELDGRSDIFSYGVVIYELISGRRPFDAKSSAEIISAILTRDPPPLRGIATNRFERLVRKCLEKEPANRYQTMEELTVELEQVKRESESGQFDTLIKNRAVPRPKATLARPYLNWRGMFSSRLTLVAMVAVITLGLAIAMYVRFFRGPTLASKPNVRYESSPGYDSYLRGKVNIKTENSGDIENAINLLKQAIAADSSLAPAYAELARAYNIKAFYFAPKAETKQLNEDAAVAVERALSLDPNLAEAHFARGLILWTHDNRFPHEQAIQAYRRALELDPNLDEAHHQLGVVYFHIGLLDKGQSELEKALAINPGNTLARFRLGAIDLYRGKYEDAYRTFKGTPLNSNPSLWAFQTGTALFRLDRIAEANELIDKFLKDYPKDEGGGVTSVKAMMLARAGKTKEAEDAIRRAIEIGTGFGHFHHTAYNIASAYALMNQPEPAVKWLQMAADDGLPCYPLFAQDSNLDSLRKDEHFTAFMTKLKQQWQHYQATL